MQLHLLLLEQLLLLLLLLEQLLLVLLLRAAPCTGAAMTNFSALTIVWMEGGVSIFMGEKIDCIFILILLTRISLGWRA